MLLSNKTYDVLKKIVQIVLPGLAVLYVALAQFWDLPKPEAVAGSIAALATFLGLVLGASTKTYNNSDVKFDGVLALEDREDGTVIKLQSVADESLLSKDEVTFKVVR